ncbi:hypothetical protein IPL68_06265 [Candidatus Saccharibacteria bacterium]|nr:MAG: hypothetical protein IPL68_06265 [Candidatus Saccharibacteria bacterium]
MTNEEVLEDLKSYMTVTVRTEVNAALDAKLEEKLEEKLAPIHQKIDELTVFVQEMTTKNLAKISHYQANR